MSWKLKTALAGTAFFVSIVYIGIHNGQKELSRAPASLDSQEESAAFANNFLPQENTRYTYSFKRKIGIHGLGNQIPEIDYHGEFYLDVFHADKKGFSALISEQVAEHPEKTPIQLRIQASADGKKLEIYSAKITNENEGEHINILKDLLANWIFPIESDTMGAYAVRFSNDQTEWKKFKLKYLGSAKTLPNITHSEHSMSWNQEISLPGTIHGEENTELGKGKMNLTAETSYQMQFLHKEKIPSADKNKIASLNNKDSLALKSDKSSAHPDYAHLNWSEIQARLKKLDSMKQSEQLLVFGDLAKYLRMNSDGIPALLAMLTPNVIQQGINSELYKVTVGALATAGSEEAQAALISLYLNTNNGTDGKGAILSSLTTTQAPLDEATRAWLLSVMQSEANANLGTGAAFALGASLQNTLNDSTSASAIQTVQNAWNASANNEVQELSILDVMGNSGRAEFFTDVQSVVNSQDDSAMRAKATFALRYMTGSNATALLTQTLTSDSDPQVRAAAANALQIATWQEAYRPAVEQCMTSETVSRIQSTCAAVLQQASPKVAQSE